MSKTIEFCSMVAQLVYIFFLMIWVYVFDQWKIKKSNNCLKLAILALSPCPAVKVLGFAVCNLNPFHKEVEEYAFKIFSTYSNTNEYQRLYSLKLYQLVLA